MASIAALSRETSAAAPSSAADTVRHDDSRLLPHGASPGAILNIGPVVDGRTAQNHFALQMARVGDSASSTVSQLNIAGGYEESPYFAATTTKTAVQMQVAVGAPTVAGSSFARCELRELDQAGANQGFDALDSGTHRLHVRIKPTHATAVKPDAVYAQLHNGTTDRIAFRTQLVSGTLRLRIRVNGSTATLDATSPINPGTTDLATGSGNIIGVEWELKIEIINGTCRVYVNDQSTPVLTTTALTSTGSSSWYFKTGCYLQSQSGVDGDSDSDYGSVEIRDLQHWHTGWPTNATFYGVPSHAATHAAAGTDPITPTDIGAALTSHSHAGADITSGTVAYARLPVGTASSTIAAGDDSRITGAVQTSRQVIAGTGLTGGGTLAADRTLTVSYGTASGTAAQGNDVRLSVKPWPPVNLTDGATPALNAALGTHFRLLAPAGNRTIAVPSNPTDGQVIVIEHQCTTSRTLALNTGTGGFAFGSDITALTATVANKTDFIQCVYNSTANKWWVIGYVKGFA